MPYGIYENGAVIAQFVVPMTLRSNKPVFVSDTLSLRRQVSRRTAQRWELETRLEPLTGGAHELFVNLITRGYTETVTIIVPQNIGVIRKRTATESPAANNAVAGTNVVTVSDNTGLIPKGTFIRFENHSKIYMTTTDRMNNGPMQIYPELRVGFNRASFNYKDDVIMPCLYDTDTVIGMSFEDGIMMDVGSVKLIERV